MKWTDLRAKLGCQCKASDAWRCARIRHLDRQIACHCQCHKYISLDDNPEPKHPIDRLLDLYVKWSKFDDRRVKARRLERGGNGKAV